MGFRHDHYHVEVPIPDGRDPDAAFAEARDALFRYRIFPRSILRPRVGTGDGVVREGAVVVFRAHFPLIPVSLEGGVRVLAVFERGAGTGLEAGIEIATLEGHPERGYEVFAIRLDRERRRLGLTIDAWSRPGSVLVRLSGPFARWVQVRASHAALHLFVRAIGDRSISHVRRTRPSP